MYHKLVIDNFAGGGGGSTGIEAALGRPVDVAINHCRFALGMHRINHPFTEHLETDVFDVDPPTVTKGLPIGLVHSSPDCRYFSKAKNGPLDNAKIRGLALVMLRWAKARAEVLTMENVEEMQEWGPLVEMVKKGKPGLYPDPRYKGRTWAAFLACLSTGIDAEHPDLSEILQVLGSSVTKAELVKGFGYTLEYRCLRGFSYRTPTTRNRLFMVARCDGKPIVWPEATHGDPKKLGPGMTKWRTIAECLDFSLKCPSIFLTRKQAKVLGCKRPLVKNTLRRVAVGMGKYVIHAAEPFIVNLTHQGGDRLEPVSEPVKTITGAHRGEKALVQATTATFVTEHANGSNQRNMPADEPMRTQCAQVKGGHFAAVSATLVQTGYGEREGQAPRVLDLQEPLGTIVASGGKHALATASMVKLRGRNIGAGADEPMHTASAGGQHHGLIAATLVRQFGESVGSEVDSPCPTVMPGGQGKTALVAACLAQHNGGFNTMEARAADEPLSTICSRGAQQQLVAASAVAYYGSETDGQGMNEPARTSTTKPRLGLVESKAVYPLTAEELAGARRVAKFLRSFGVEFEGEFATVKGHVIVDIGMRMLTPRELFRAQGFPDDYVIDRAWVVDKYTGETREVKLTKEQQIRMCGNSVCPPVMEALIRANVPEMCLPKPPKKWRPSLELMKRAKLVA